MLGHSIVSQHFMEPEGSLLNSQELSTCSYHEEILYLLKWSSMAVWPVGAETCSGYEIVIKTIVVKNTVVIDGTPKDY
jgi:hypothetical protein